MGQNLKLKGSKVQLSRKKLKKKDRTRKDLKQSLWYLISLQYKNIMPCNLCKKIEKVMKQLPTWT